MDKNVKVQCKKFGKIKNYIIIKLIVEWMIAAAGYFLVGSSFVVFILKVLSI
jgi:hypothetical protein